MSSQLPIVDLTGAIVGQVFKIDFTPFVKFNPANISQNAHLAIYNESGCGLVCTMNQSGTQFFIPAGGWGISNIAPNDATCSLVVRYLITNAPVSNLIATYYAPSEEVPQSYTLGNSPVGGAVSTTGGGVATSVANDGNPAVVFVEGTLQGNSLGSNVEIFNTGEFVLQEYTGSAINTLVHVVPNTSPGASDIFLGKAGSTTEIVGYLTVDHDVNIIGNTTIQAVSSTQAFTHSGASGVYQNIGTHNPSIDLASATGAVGILTGSGKIQANTAQSLVLDTVSIGNNINLDIAGSIIAHIAAGQVTLNQELAINSGVFSTVNGSVSGTADLYCPIWGSALKIGWVNLRSNFNTASNVTLLFPTPQMNFAWFVSGDISGTTWQAFLGASPAAMRHTLTIGGASAGGTSESISNIKNLNFGQFLGSDRVIINTTGGGNINSFFWFIGQ